MNGRWRRSSAHGPPLARLAVARPARRANGRRRSGTARCSRSGTARVRGLGPDLLAPETTLPTSSRDSAASISRASSGTRSSISASSPGSGTCGSRRRSGTPVCRRGRGSATSTTRQLEAALGWAQQAMRAAVAGVETRASRLSPRRTGMSAVRGAVRSRGLGDANRTAYWCPRCQPSAGSAEREGFEPSTSGLPPVTP